MVRPRRVVNDRRIHLKPWIDVKINRITTPPRRPIISMLFVSVVALTTSFALGRKSCG